MGMSNKAKILHYIYLNKQSSKVDLVNSLGLSLPTVLQIVKDLQADGMLIEAGTSASTGGRKATLLELNGERAYVIGIDITANHLTIVFQNFAGECLASQRQRKAFAHHLDYYQELKREIDYLLAEHGLSDATILGMGLSFPGIIDQANQSLVKSHALNLENISLNLIQQLFDYPIYFENDANAAFMAEHPLADNNVFLSLSNTVGGALCINKQLVRGDNNKGSEFGHMILVPGGRQCYCGKTGCVDAYCSVLALTGETMDLGTFMERLDQGDVTIVEGWNNYLDNLAIVITNLRMAFDMEIILGGYLGEYLPKHMITLSQKIAQYNTFEQDNNYVKIAHFGKEAAAIGVGKFLIEDYIRQQ